MDMYITWELLSISAAKLVIKIHYTIKTGNRPIFGCKVDLKVIGARYHMGIAQYFGCKVDLSYQSKGHVCVACGNHPVFWL